MNPSEATREVLWNVSYAWMMYVLLVPTILISGYGIVRRVQSWKRGMPANRFDRPVERLRHLWKHALLQRRVLRDRYAGIFHAFIFYGFIVLTIATVVVMIHHDFGLPIMSGRFYLYFQSLFVDLLGVFAAIGLGMAGYRRWLVKPRKLIYTDEASWILAAGFVIVATGFLLEGWRIAATDDPWGVWSPAGYLVGLVSEQFVGKETLKGAHVVLWWFHLILVFAVIAWAPYTKMLHPFTSALNIYAANLEPIGASLKRIDFEKAENFGVNKLAQLSWKDLLDLDACTECGRCTDACPAHRVGKSLSPRDIILDLRTLLRIQPNGKATDDQSSGDSTLNEGSNLVGATNALSPDALWQCTSCGACMEACPVSIEPFPKIIDMRRFQVMEESDFPGTLQSAISSLESRGHPFSGSRFSRLDWTEGLQIPLVADTKDAEVLLWVGCGGALVERNQKSTRALAQLLTEAGVKFAILGREEKCTGDPARRIGNEFLFEQLANENLQTLKRHNLKTVVTSCPHCFNTFRNEYPQLGGDIEVYHHSAFLAKLVEQNRLKFDSKSQQRFTFHDPCYLGRHNDITEAPRTVLERATGQPPIELERNRRNSFCCGGGGGMSFVEEPANQRVNQERAREIVESDADTVVVGCPFCTTMLEDGINACAGGKKIEVKELSEVVLEAIHDYKGETDQPDK